MSLHQEFSDNAHDQIISDLTVQAKTFASAAGHEATCPRVCRAIDIAVKRSVRFRSSGEVESPTEIGTPVYPNPSVLQNAVRISLRSIAP